MTRLADLNAFTGPNNPWLHHEDAAWLRTGMLQRLNAGADGVYVNGIYRNGTPGLDAKPLNWARLKRAVASVRRQFPEARIGTHVRTRGNYNDQGWPQHLHGAGPWARWIQPLIDCGFDLIGIDASRQNPFTVEWLLEAQREYGVEFIQEGPGSADTFSKHEPLGRIGLARTMVNRANGSLPKAGTRRAPIYCWMIGGSPTFWDRMNMSREDAIDTIIALGYTPIIRPNSQMGGMKQIERVAGGHR